MKTNTILLSIVLCFCCFASKAQDLHYSNYNYAPLYLNPATTGGFNGFIRAGASHRDQFRTFIGEAYQSTMIWADSPVSFVLDERKWLGLGINLFSDRVGDLGFGMSGGYLSSAFHWSLDDRYTSVFALGVQYGIIQRSFSKESAAQFADELSGGSTSPDQNLLTNFNATYGDLNLGLTFKHWATDDNLLEIGVSTHHINNGNFAFPTSGYTNTIASRFNVYASMQMQTSEKFQITPAAYFSQYQNVSNIQIQVNTKTLLQRKSKKKSRSRESKPRSETYLTYGLGYRIGDAVQFFAGGIYKSWEFGISYDMTTSTARRYNNTVGGLELGIKKYFTNYKKPKLKIVKICPRV